MLKKLISITAVIAISVAALSAGATGEPSLKDQILAIDKDLTAMRKATHDDPEVKAAFAEVQAALNKFNVTVDTVMVRTNPKSKELLEKHKQLVEQYKAQVQAQEKAKP